MCSQQGKKTNCPPVFFSTGETASGVLSPVLGSPVRERCACSGVSAVEANQGGRGLEHVACTDGLWELGLFSVTIRRQREDIVEVFSYLKGEYREDRA